MDVISEHLRHSDRPAAEARSSLRQANEEGILQDSIFPQIKNNLIVEVSTNFVMVLIHVLHYECAVLGCCDTLRNAVAVLSLLLQMNFLHLQTLPSNHALLQLRNLRSIAQLT